ncbi:MAG: ABC transporter permease [Vicinamibacterales bacterium]
MPSPWRAVVIGFRRLFRRSAAARDLDDEVESYLEAARDAYRKAGLTPEDAARASRVELGSLTAVKDQVRMSGWESVVDATWRDVQYAARRLRRSPGFTVAAFLVLALGIGANVAIFSIVNALLIRPLPVEAPEELVFIDRATSTFTCCTVREANAYDAATDIFRGVATFRSQTSTLGVGPDAMEALGESVSTNYFGVLGLRPRLGRAFSTIDDVPGATPVVIISERLWRSRFDADPNVLGRRLRLASRDMVDSGWLYTVVGVMDKAFSGLDDPWRSTEFWVPRSQRQRERDQLNDADRLLPDREASAGHLVARLQRHVPAARAQAFVNTTHPAFGGPSLNNRRPSLDNSLNPADRLLAVRTSRRITLPMDSRGRIAPERLAAALMALAGLVLALGVTNLAGVTIARGIVRQPELTLRVTLGATRGRVARQLAIEGLLLSTSAAMGGVLLSRWLVTAFLRNLPARSFTAAFASIDVPMDVRVCGVAVVTAIATGLIVGLAPVRRISSGNLLASLGHASDVSPRRVRARLRYWIVLPQVAACVGLLLGAGIAVRALIAVATVDLGYKQEQAAMVQWAGRRFGVAPGASAQGSHEADTARQRQFNRRVLELAASSPELVAAGLTDALPTEAGRAGVINPARFAVSAGPIDVATAQITQGYFDAIGVRVLLGRGIDARDTLQSPAIAIVSESVAARLWPGRSAIGQSIGFHRGSREPDWLEVIGVVNDVRLPLSEGEPQPVVYVAMNQENALLRRSTMFLVARGKASGRDVASTLRSIVWHADPEMEIAKSQTLQSVIDDVRYARHFAVALLASSGVCGLLLAGLGLYALVSHSVAQRMRELAIRAALGAGRIEIMNLVVHEGITVAAIGSVVGLLLAFIGMHIVSHQVFAIPAVDLTTALIVIAIVAVVVVLAAVIPARRAARADPMTILRWQ